MVINGRHRSAAHAERHRKELERKHGFAAISARRNDKGRFSSRGRNFTFEVEDTKVEYVVHFDYGSKKESNLIRFQVHIEGPEASDRDAIDAIKKIEKGETPEGWRVRKIRWGHPPHRAKNRPDATTARVQPSAIFGGSADVSRKTPIKQHRRTKGAL